jgi:hypothetical protein
MNLNNGIIMNLECPVYGSCTNEECKGSYDSIQGDPFAKDEDGGRFQCNTLIDALNAEKRLKDSEFIESIGGGSV